MAPFLPDHWERFYIRLSLTGPVITSGRTDTLLSNFLHINSCGRIISDHPAFLLTFGLIESGGRFVLRGRHTPSHDPKLQSHFFIPLEPGQARCLEIHCTYQEPDSAFLELYADGVLVFSVRGGYYLPKTMLYRWLISEVRPTMSPWRLDLDEYVISSRRPFGIPTVPANPRESIDGGKVLLECDSFISNYAGERVTAADYLLFRSDMDGYPLYRETYRDPAFFHRRPLPFPLETGDYAWQMRFETNHGAWSNRSPLRSFSITSHTPEKARLERCYLTKPSRPNPLTSITIGRDYDLHFRIAPGAQWPIIAYLLAGLSHREHQHGHPKNRGGFFIPESNYTFNISFPERFPSNQKFMIYEKQPGSLMSHLLSTEQPTGRYVLGTSADLRVDTAIREIVLPFRLLDTAVPGPWVLTGSLFTLGDSLANIVRVPIRVAAPRTRRWLVLAGALLPALAVAMVLMRRRKKVLPETPRGWDPEMERIAQYLTDHLTEELSAEKIRRDLRISTAGFYRILKANGISSLPRLQNRLRVDRAKLLIRDTDKNFSEIAIEVGFKELPYFTKVFKDTTGKTPSEYRKSLSPVFTNQPQGPAAPQP